MNLRRKSSEPAGIEARISSILAEVEPLLRMEHCTLRLDSYTPGSGVAVIAIAGSCPDCAVSPATFSSAIEAHVRMRVPEVREVRVAG